jgi:putative transposase
MSRYRRALAPGGTFLFTVNLADRRSALLTEHIDLLRAAYGKLVQELPFDTVAVCILPDHLHAVWRLPPTDADFSTRWQRIKAHFSHSFPAQAERSQSKQRQGEKGIWQRRFWEHQIRDDADLQRHVDYLHYNPVKHGLASRVSDWPHSSFHRYVREGQLPLDWAGGGKDGNDFDVGE